MGTKAQIIVTQEGQPEIVKEIEDRLTVGRSTSNDLQIDDQNASRRHAEIRLMSGQRYQVTDVGSANGTWVNGRRLTVPRELDDGDQIVIGNIMLRFVAPDEVDPADPHTTTSITGAALNATALAMRNETVVILVSDIRGYTSMSELLPPRDFSKLVADWFRESSEIIDKYGGTIDKFIGDAVMVYWVVPNPDDPSEEARSALATARDMIYRAEIFSERISGQFPGNTFRVGIGINMGEAIFGNVGTGEVQSFTIVGDSVNVAFRLESVTKEKKVDVIASKAVADLGNSQFNFRDLGEVEVKGRREPISIWAMEIESETRS